MSVLNENEMKVTDYYFDLPQEQIAQDPLEDRSSSRLLVLDKETGEYSHHVFREITEFLKPGDCLVLNNTKVIPARLFGEKRGDSGKNRDSSAETQGKRCLGNAGKNRAKNARSEP